MRVLVIEDGYEYSQLLGRFLGEQFDFVRAGSGVVALQILRDEPMDVVFLDMRFDRCPPGELLGDFAKAAERFNGDPVQGRTFLEDHQGTFVLAALREAGHAVPVLMSYDFDSEPRRWERLAGRFGPVAYLGDNAGPTQITEALDALGQS